MRLTGALARKLMPRLRRYFGINLICVLRHDANDVPLVSGCRRPVECRVLTQAETLAFAADPALKLDPDWVRGAFARGAVCLGAVEEGRLLAYTWLAYSDTPYAAGVWIELGPGLRYTHKSFVRRDCRGQRLIRVLHCLADRPELWRGRHGSVSFVNFDNTASLSALRRSGCRMLGYVGYLRLFGLLFPFYSPKVQRAGIRLYAPRAGRAAARMRAWSLSPDSSA